MFQIQGRQVTEALCCTLGSSLATLLIQNLMQFIDLWLTICPTRQAAACRGLLSPSKQQNLITGLNLLRLLVQNRIAEFHTELELIPQQVPK